MTIDREETKTLRELGIDGALAREIECAIKITHSNFNTFVSPSGKRYKIAFESDHEEINRAA